MTIREVGVMLSSATAVHSEVRLQLDAASAGCSRPPELSLSPLASQQKGLESPLLVRRFLVISKRLHWAHIYRKGNLWGGFWAVCWNVVRDTAGPQVRPGTGTL